MKCRVKNTLMNYLEFLKTKNINKPIEYTIHPSKRNSFLYNKNRENVLIKLRKIIK